MIDRIMQTVYLWTTPCPPCGTPENPEVFEKGEKPQAPRFMGPPVFFRLPIALFLLTLMVSLTLPAAFVIWGNYLLLTKGFGDGSYWNILVFLILAPVSYMFILATFFMDMVFIGIIWSMIRGKPFVRYGFVRTGRRRPPASDASGNPGSSDSDPNSNQGSPPTTNS